MGTIKFFDMKAKKLLVLVAALVVGWLFSTVVLADEADLPPETRHIQEGYNGEIRQNQGEWFVVVVLLSASTAFLAGGIIGLLIFHFIKITKVIDEMDVRIKKIEMEQKQQRKEGNPTNQADVRAASTPIEGTIVETKKENNGYNYGTGDNVTADEETAEEKQEMVTDAQGTDVKDVKRPALSMVSTLATTLDLEDGFLSKLKADFDKTNVNYDKNIRKFEQDYALKALHSDAIGGTGFSIGEDKSKTKFWVVVPSENARGDGTHYVIPSLTNLKMEKNRLKNFEGSGLDKLFEYRNRNTDDENSVTLIEPAMLRYRGERIETLRKGELS